MYTLDECSKNSKIQFMSGELLFFIDVSSSFEIAELHCIEMVNKET